MPLEFNQQFVLPEGVHDADIEEIENTFGQFQRSTCRPKLFRRLDQYLKELRSAGIGKCLILDGSFVMGGVDEPNDIDIILVLDDNWDMSGSLRPQQYNLISRRDVRRNFPFDLFVVRSGSSEEAKWLDFFSRINVKWYESHGFDIGARKGLVRINI